MTVSMFINSVWAYSPKINDFKITTENMSRYLDDVKFTPSDLSNQTYSNLVPTYTSSTLAPQVPTYSAKFEPPQVHVPVFSSEQPSLTSQLINQAKAIKAYKG